MLSPKFKYLTNKNICQRTTGHRLKLKGLDGTLYPSRGACSIIDKPRYTLPSLANPAYIPPSSANPKKALK